MKRTWRMKLGQVRALMTHGKDSKGVWSGAAYKVELTAVLAGPAKEAGRELTTTMTAAQARSLARVLTDMAASVDSQNLHNGYRVQIGDDS